MVAAAPQLCADAEQARHAWQFCGGWRPLLWPTYGALHQVEDWHLLIDLMAEIKNHV